MQEAVLTGIRQMQVREAPDPTITNGRDVLIRMATVGVCGSDVHYYTTGRIGSQVVHYPFAVGHEGAGLVEAIGSQVTRVHPGDRIAIEPAVSCAACGLAPDAWCDQCRASRPHTCRKLRFLGCPGQLPGCLAELLVMPEECCFPIPETMSLTQAALSEPMAIGVYAVRQSPVGEGSTVGILGCGPIGLCVLAAARAKGAREVFMTDPIDARLAVANCAGAAWTGNPDRRDVVSGILAKSPGGLDVVFECCGQQEALDQAVALLRPGGTLMLVGIPETDRVSFPIDTLRRRELTLVNVRRQNGCVQATLDGIADGSLPADFLVTHRFPLANAQAAFDLVAAYQDGVVKAMIDFATP